MDEIDGLYKAIMKIRSLHFFEPDGTVKHPADWEPIRYGTEEYRQKARDGREKSWQMYLDYRRLKERGEL